MTVLIPLAPEHVRIVWPSVEKWVVEVAERSSEWTVEGIVHRFMTGAWQPWIVKHDDPGNTEILALLATEFWTDDRGQSLAGIPFITGTEMDTWTHHLDEMEAYLRSRGVWKVKFTCRPGWTKKLRADGYDYTHAVCEKVI